MTDNTFETISVISSTINVIGYRQETGSIKSQLIVTFLSENVQILDHEVDD